MLRVHNVFFSATTVIFIRQAPMQPGGLLNGQLHGGRLLEMSRNLSLHVSSLKKVCGCGK